MLERHVTVMEEKQVILKRQQEEVSRLVQTQVGGHAEGPSGLKEWSRGGQVTLGICGLWLSQLPATAVLSRVRLYSVQFGVSLDLRKS